MASAFTDKSGYIADFRGFQQSGKQRRRVRIAKKVLSVNPSINAHAFAQECERYCRYLEVYPDDIDAVLHAYKIGAITDTVKECLIGNTQYNVVNPPDGALSIVEACLQHPSVIKDRTNDPHQYLEHRKYLSQFIEWAGIKNLEDVTLAIVQNYVQHLRALGYASETRKHKIRYLRRACKAGTIFGLPDCIGGWKLDSDDRRKKILFWTLEELLGMVDQYSDNHNILTIIYLGGFMGLRPSEIYRSRKTHISSGVLSIGEEVSKNAFSQRDLPLPEIIHQHLIRTETELLVPRPDGRIHDEITFPRVFKSAGFSMSPKFLRKSFATWAIEKLPPRHVETFLGHVCGQVGSMTSKHYLGTLTVKEMAPSAALINLILCRNS